MKLKSIIPVFLIASVLVIGGSGVASAVYPEDQIETVVLTTMDGTGTAIDTWTIESDPSGGNYTTTTEWSRLRLSALRVHVSKDNMEDPSSTTEAENLVSAQLEVTFYDDSGTEIGHAIKSDDTAYHVEEKTDYHVVDIEQIDITSTDGHPNMDYGYYADVTVEYRLIT